MGRFGTCKTLAIAAAGWLAAAASGWSAPAWDGGGQPLEITDLPPSVVVQPGQRRIIADRPLELGEPPLPPEPMPAEVSAAAPEGVIAESEESPGFIPGFQLPQGIQMPRMPEQFGRYFPDSSAVAGDEPSWAESVTDRVCGLKQACWTVRAEAIALWRNAPSSRPLFTTIVDDGFGNQALGPVVLDANQLVSDPLAAGRLTLGRLDDCGRGIETSYLYAGTFYSARSLPYAQDQYALASPGIYGNPWGIPTQGSGPDATPISAAQTQLTGALQSLEVNYREPLGWGATRFLAGFRWLQWQETWSMADQFTDPNDPAITGFDSYNTACINDLYGGQIGLDTVLWNPGEGLRLESVVKAGAYYNNASQSSSYQYQTTQPFAYAQSIAVGKNPAGCSFVGELGITAVVPLAKHLDLRCGYFGLWLDSIAQPINQLNGQNLSQKGPGAPATGSLVTNGTLVLQGVSLGLEGRW